MDFCRFFLVCFLSLPNIGLIESFDFDVCSSTKGENVEVTYGTLSVKCGQSYLLKDVNTSIPTIRFAAADKTKLYEVLMFDPDAPSAIKPSCRSWLHLMISNVMGSDLSSGISPDHISLSIKTEYNPPSPPKGTDYHRYIVAVFSHEEHIDVNVLSQRCGFNIEAFGTLHKLSKIPDAMNMFKTKTP